MGSLLAKLKDKIENTYYDGDTWFDGREYPERLRALKEKIQEEDRRKAELEAKYQPQEEHLR